MRRCIQSINEGYSQFLSVWAFTRSPEWVISKHDLLHLAICV